MRACMRGGGGADVHVCVCVGGWMHACVCAWVGGWMHAWGGRVVACFKFYIFYLVEIIGLADSGLTFAVCAKMG